MKKPFTHEDRDSQVKCANPHCAEVRGIEGVIRQSIKKNVIARAKGGQDKFYCYDCQQFAKTGLTRSERKAKERKEKREREEKARIVAEDKAMKKSK